MIPDPLFRMGEKIPGTPYSVRRNLGKGGMAVTFLVDDTVLKRIVVLKILRPELVGHPAADLMIREARALDALGTVSTGFLRVFQFGEITVDLSPDAPLRLPYYSMERIDGPTLRRMIHENARRGHPIGIVPALQIAIEVATALQKAHDLGIVHRDVKPENIMVHMRGDEVVVKIIDLGVHSWQREYHDENDTKFRGTIEYAAPEHLLERSVSPAIDVYALGLVLFELLALRPPFTGTQHEIIHGHLYRAPPNVSEVRAANTGARDVPPELDDFIRRALAKDPANRTFGAVGATASVQTALLFAQEAKTLRQRLSVGRDADMLYGEAVKVRDPNNTSSAGRASSSRRRIVSDGAQDIVDAGASTAPMASSPADTSSGGPFASGPPVPEIAENRVLIVGEATRSAPAERPIAALDPPKFTQTLPHHRPVLATAHAHHSTPGAADRTDEIDMAWLREYEQEHEASDERSMGEILEEIWEDNVYQDSEFDHPIEASLPVALAPERPPEPAIAPPRARVTDSHTVAYLAVFAGTVIVIVLMTVAFIEHWGPFAR